MKSRYPWSKRLPVIGCWAAGLVAVLAFAPPAAADPGLTTLYSFCPSTGCADGTTPYAGSLVTRGGTYYGAAALGGSTNNAGVVYSLARKPKAIAFTQTVLYTFCPTTGCVDGSEPVGRLIVEKDGTIYGTTLQGGANNKGTAFKLTPNAKKTAYTESVLYSFCSLGSCADGQQVFSGLIMDGKGNLFGTAQLGGTHSDGVVFELTPNAKKTKYTETVLYNFCTLPSCTDGSQPVSDLVMDAKGNLYGTATTGGANNGGVVFKLTPNAKTHSYSEQVLYSFCSTGGGSCTDGKVPPYGSLLMEKQGDIFGTTNAGGNGNHGVVYELTPHGSTYTETVLYTFCSYTSCQDGAGPLTGVVRDKAGDLYGTTQVGGASNKGTVYAVILDKSEHVYGEAVLYDFCSLGGCTDGSAPIAGLLLEKHGMLVGTTSEGGGAGQGTVFLLGP